MLIVSAEIMKAIHEREMQQNNKSKKKKKKDRKEPGEQKLGQKGDS